MADFNKPTGSELYTLVWQQVRDVVANTLKMLDGTTDSNLPDKAKRYNATTNKFQVYNSAGGTWSDLPFHTTIDSHIADTTLHSGVPAGTLLEFAGATLPTGFLWAHGQAISRTTYAGLFTAIGTTHGVGDGSTTFNVPDTRGRFLLGRQTSGSFSTLGQTGGSLDHTHSTPNHTHTIPTHVHDITHSHALNDHTHTTANHTHSVGAHYHNVTGNGATIAIASSGSHQHDYGTRANSGSNSENRAAMSSGSGGTGTNQTSNNTVSNHTHANSAFTGAVGNVSGGVSGDAAFNTSSAGAAATSGVTGGAGSTQSYAGNTGASGTLTTNSTGAATSGTANPAYLVVNYIIKT